MVVVNQDNIRNIILSFFCSTIVYFLGYEPYGNAPQLLAAISSLVVFYTFFEIVFSKNMKFIYLGVFLTLNWVYFQSPFLLEEKTYYFTRTIDEADIPEISIYCCFSIFLIYIGYHFFFNRISALSSPELKFEESTFVKLILVFLAFGLFDSLGSRLFPSIMGPLSNLVQVFFYSYTIAFGLYTILLLRTKTKFIFSFFNILVISLFLLEFVLRISSTMFVRTSFLFIGIFMAYFYETRRIPVVFLIVSLVILIPFYQARTYFRILDRVQEESFASKGHSSNLERGQDFISKIYSSEGDEVLDKLEQSQAKRQKFQSNRFENLSFIGHVVYVHKIGMKDFLYGETFYWLPFTPIPRIIWKNKPLNLMSSTFASEYGLRGKESGSTSINFPMLVEAYVNFGYPGMLFMAFFFGVLLKWFAMKFGIGIGDLNLIIMLNAVKQFTHAEGNITLVFGALLQVFIFWFVLLKIFRINKSITTL